LLDDVVPAKDRSGFVAGYFHRDRFRYAEPSQVACGSSPEIVKQQSGVSPAKAISAFASCLRRLLVLALSANELCESGSSACVLPCTAEILHRFVSLASEHVISGLFAGAAGLQKHEAFFRE
jgi:hypothetical protein